MSDAQANEAERNVSDALPALWYTYPKMFFLCPSSLPRVGHELEVETS